MNTRGFSAYNLARGALLNSKLTLADSGNQPLKLLDIVVSGMGMDPTAGLWLTPLHAIPAVPRVFPFDLIYLDKEYRVLDIAEMGPGIEFPAFHAEVSSALVLPSDTLRRTHTAPADHLIVCVSSELETLLAAASLPSSDTAQSVHESVVPNALPTIKPSKPTIIELAPEKPYVAPSSPVSAFDESILTAVAKVAEARNTMEPKPPARQSTDPGPSIAITEAVLDSPRKIQPAIIEHRIDPEDLFSNWVASPPPMPQHGRITIPEPPSPPKPEIPAQETGPEIVRQNGRKHSVSAKPAADPAAQSRESRAASTSLTASAASKAQSRLKPETSDRPAPPARSRTAPVKAAAPADAPGKTLAIPPATTFTAVPYGMWQVSMPTAVAPMTGAKSPEPAKVAPPPNRTIGTKQPAPKTPAGTSAAIDRPRSSADSKVQADPQPALKPQPSTQSVPKTEAIVNSPRPALRDEAASEVHRPGDFVASLQEKLQRVQQFRPAHPAFAETTVEESTSASTSSAPAPPSPLTSRQAPTESPVPTRQAVPARQPEPDARTSAAPIPKSKPATTVPAKPKSEPAAPGGFRSRFKQWLNPASSPSDRRRATRRYVPGMVAHYFTGGAPKPKNVADISMSGMYLLTDDRWMPGTMIQMTLQKPCAQGEKKQSINVLSRIVRRGSDGVAAEFVMPDALSHISHDIQPSQATDKFALARFL